METTTASPTASVTVHDDEVTVTGIRFSDPMVAAHFAQIPEEMRTSELIRAIGIGVHGLAATTLHATVDEMQQQVKRIITAAADAAECQLDTVVTAGRSQLAAQLDPEVRSSLTARTVAELSELHANTLTRLDPERTDSHTGKLVAAITDLLGPEGMLAQRLDDAFDSAEADHGLGRLLDTIERRFQEMRDLLVVEQGRQEEAERGTAKGFEFEDELEELLRSEARAMHGCVVERTAASGGTLGNQAKVGDFTITLTDGTRIVIEAKNTARIGLAGNTGILSELDEAMDNRQATWAICVSRRDAFPGEVGTFGVYGNRILVVDGGDGTLTRVALRWIAAAARSGAELVDAVDTQTALERLDRVRGLAQHFSRSKKVLGSAQSSLDTVRDELDAIRSELLELVDDTVRALSVPVTPAPRQVA